MRLVLAALALTACTSAPTLQCQPSIACGMEQVQVCCTTTACEYHVAGIAYACAGTDCTAAAAQVHAFCPDSGIVPDAGAASDTGVDAGP